MFQGGLNVFISHAREDEEFLRALETHLASLRRQGLVRTWHSGRVRAGGERREQIEARLEDADVVLLLISSDFIASSHCWTVEMKRAA